MSLIWFVPNLTSEECLLSRKGVNIPPAYRLFLSVVYSFSGGTINLERSRNVSVLYKQFIRILGEYI